MRHTHKKNNFPLCKTNNENNYNKFYKITEYVCFTCSDHALSMGRGWQAVGGRAMVHNDRQG